jgi:hypothetical protein
LNIPNKVKIGWRTYDIEQGEHRSAECGGDLYGEIRYEQNKIYLYDKQDEENKKVTLLHEILHGIAYMIGNDEFRKDEGLITALSESFYQIMKDNPEIFKEE